MNNFQKLKVFKVVHQIISCSGNYSVIKIFPDNILLCCLEVTFKSCVCEWLIQLECKKINKAINGNAQCHLYLLYKNWIVSSVTPLCEFSINRIVIFSSQGIIQKINK